MEGPLLVGAGNDQERGSRKVSVKLEKLGLAREIEAKPGVPIWRGDDAGQGYALKLKAAGLKAIAVDEGSQDGIEPSRGACSRKRDIAPVGTRRPPGPGGRPRDGS